MTDIFVGIDCGTQSVKAAAWDNCGVELASTKRELVENCLQGTVNWQSPSEWWDRIGECCRELVVQLGSRSSRYIRSIGLCGTCSTLLGVDDDWHPVTNAVLWSDQQSRAHAVLLTEKLHDSGIQHTIVADEFAARLLWILEEMPKANWVESVSWLVERLCGARVLADSIFRGRWGSIRVPRIFNGLSASFPQLREAWELAQLPVKQMGDRAGWLQQRAADHLGLNSNSQIAVAVGGNDGLISAIGGGLLEGFESALEVGGSSYPLFFHTSEKIVSVGDWSVIDSLEIKGTTLVTSFPRAGLDFARIHSSSGNINSRYQQEWLMNFSQEISERWMQLSRPIPEVTIVGGFAKNDNFVHYRRQSTKGPLNCLQYEAGCAGAAISAGCASGHYSDLLAAASSIYVAKRCRWSHPRLAP